MTCVCSTMLWHSPGLHVGSCESRVTAEGFASLLLSDRDISARPYHNHTSSLPGSPFSPDNRLGL